MQTFDSDECEQTSSFRAIVALDTDEDYAHLVQPHFQQSCTVTAMLRMRAPRLAGGNLKKSRKYRSPQTSHFSSRVIEIQPRLINDVEDSSSRNRIIELSARRQIEPPAVYEAEKLLAVSTHSQMNASTSPGYLFRTVPLVSKSVGTSSLEDEAHAPTAPFFTQGRLKNDKSRSAVDEELAIPETCTPCNLELDHWVERLFEMLPAVSFPESVSDPRSTGPLAIIATEVARRQRTEINTMWHFIKRGRMKTPLPPL